MYFPFLTCKVKCSNTSLEIADRQNSYSNIFALRNFVELFRLAKRENEIYKEVMTFLVSHNHLIVRLYGYYPVIARPKTRIYRHLIDTFNFTVRDGKDKLNLYKFAVAVYEYLLTLHKSICLVIDEFPDFNLKTS